MHPRSSSPTVHPDDAPASLAGVIDRNIAALVEERRRVERGRSLQERLADAVTRLAGSMLFVYLHLAVFGGWIVINLGWLPLEPFDPSLVKLATAASVEAIFLSTFVLISQNRMHAAADKRADLDVQISLLAEHEITRLLRLTTAMARRMGVDEALEPELGELSHDIHPAKVLTQLESAEAELESAKE